MTETEIVIFVNGERREIPPGLTILVLIQDLGLDAERLAVELNREIVRRPLWGSTALQSGSALEIVQFVGGG